MERKVKFAPNEYYHLYSRGVEKRKIFISPKDYDRFIALLYIMNKTEAFNFKDFLKFHKLSEVFEIQKDRQLVSILSYALMPNHFHILVHENEEGGISKFMMRLLTAYSMYFNKKNNRSGPLFTHPFRSQHISTEAQYLWIFSYIHLNPIKIANKDFKNIEAEDKIMIEKFLASYKYSSYIDYIDKTRVESKIIDFSLIPAYLTGEMTTQKYDEWSKIPRATLGI